MSRAFVVASSQYLEHPAAIVSAYPLTMACWFNPNSASAYQCVMGIADSASGSNFHGLLLRGDVVGDPLQVITSVVGATATTTTGYTANTWHHGAGVFASAASRSVYIDGGSKDTNTGSTTPTGLN